MMTNRCDGRSRVPLIGTTVDRMTREAADGWAERGVERAIELLGGGPWDVTLMPGTGGAQWGSSVARLRAGDESVVVKVICRNDADLADPASWRREPDMYRSAWLVELMPDGLATPACLASTVDDETAVLVLEDVPFDDRDARSVEWYGRLAERLARLNAAPLDGVPEWASRDFVASEAALAVAPIPDMAAAPSPLVADLVDEWRPVLERLVAAMPQVLDGLAARPHGFHHLDAFSRNAAEVGERMVLIDWAFAGVAPIGTDAAAVVAMTSIFGDAPDGDVAALHRSVVDGFAAGVAAARDQPDVVVDLPDLEASIETLLTLRWTGFLSQAHALGEALVDTVESVSGRPFDEVRQVWAAGSEFVLPMADASLARVDA